MNEKVAFRVMVGGGCLCMASPAISLIDLNPFILLALGGAAFLVGGLWLSFN